MCCKMNFTTNNTLLSLFPPQDMSIKFANLDGYKEKEDFLYFVRWRDNFLGSAILMGPNDFLEMDIPVYSCQKCLNHIKNETFLVTFLPSKENDVIIPICFHLNCFLCTTCCKQLPPYAFYFDPGFNLFCGKHFSELFRPRCKTCQRLIFSEECIYMSDGLTWHMDHFVCKKCQAPLDIDDFGEEIENLVCVPCLNKDQKDKNIYECIKEIKSWELMPNVSNNNISLMQDNTYNNYDESCCYAISPINSLQKSTKINSSSSLESECEEYNSSKILPNSSQLAPRLGSKYGYNISNKTQSPHFHNENCSTCSHSSETPSTEESEFFREYNKIFRQTNTHLTTDLINNGIESSINNHCHKKIDHKNDLKPKIPVYRRVDINDHNNGNNINFLEEKSLHALALNNQKLSDASFTNSKSNVQCKIVKTKSRNLFKQLFTPKSSQSNSKIISNNNNNNDADYNNITSSTYESHEFQFMDCSNQFEKLSNFESIKEYSRHLKDMATNGPSHLKNFSNNSKTRPQLAKYAYENDCENDDSLKLSSIDNNNTNLETHVQQPLESISEIEEDFYKLGMGKHI